MVPFLHQWVLKQWAQLLGWASFLFQRIRGIWGFMVSAFLNKRITHTKSWNILGLNAALAYIGIVSQKECWDRFRSTIFYLWGLCLVASTDFKLIPRTKKVDDGLSTGLFHSFDTFYQSSSWLFPLLALTSEYFHQLQVLHRYLLSIFVHAHHWFDIDSLLLLSTLLFNKSCFSSEVNEKLQIKDCGNVAIKETTPHR